MANRLSRSRKPGSPSRASGARDGAINSLLYFYGITQAAAALPPVLRGVDGISPVEPLACAGFTCWTSRVDALEFGQKLSHNMENLEWLADVSVRHQRVVGAIHQRQPMLPARFGAVFLSPESLRRDVTARRAALEAGFRRISGADEWGIRVFALPRSSPAGTAARSGREYLRRKSALLQSKPSRTLEPEIKEFAAALARLAAASAEGGKVSSGQPGLRWHTSVLVPRARRARLEALVMRFARRFKDRFRVECTGPWPPYSFAGQTAQPAPTRVAR
jgi:Gas vesicle synthesis protein GvpL/GvpF